MFMVVFSFREDSYRSLFQLYPKFEGFFNQEFRGIRVGAPNFSANKVDFTIKLVTNFKFQIS